MYDEFRRAGPLTLTRHTPHFSDIADAVICCVPGEDRTNGFFVSCFIRDVPEYQPIEIGRGRKRPRHVDVEEPYVEPKRSKVDEEAEFEPVQVDASELATAGSTAQAATGQTTKSKTKSKKKKGKKMGLGA